jgi:hypothetical protein
MTVIETILVPVFSALVIAVMLAICLRSKASVHDVSGRRQYRIHGAWFVFCALGGALVVGVFALAGAMARPENRPTAVWCSVASTIFFVFFALVMRSLRVTVDDDAVTTHNLFAKRSVALRDVDHVNIVGLLVEVRLKADAAIGKCPRPLVFLAGFRGLDELIATIRARSSAPGARSATASASGPKVNL